VLDINLANARSVAERIGGTAFEVDVTDESRWPPPTHRWTRCTAP
jgi:hypothetical protein